MNKSDFGSSKFEFNLFHRVVFLDKKLCFILSFYTQFTVFLRVLAICGGARGGQGDRSPPPPNKNFAEPPTFWCRKALFKDVFHNTDDVGIFRGDIFCPQTTQVNNAKSILENLRRGLRMAKWKMTFQNTPLPLPASCCCGLHCDRLLSRSGRCAWVEKNSYTPMFGACVHGVRVRYSPGFNVNTPFSSTHKRNSGTVESLYSGT